MIPAHADPNWLLPFQRTCFFRRLCLAAPRSGSDGFASKRVQCLGLSRCRTILAAGCLLWNSDIDTALVPHVRCEPLPAVHRTLDCLTNCVLFCSLFGLFVCYAYRRIMSPRMLSLSFFPFGTGVAIFVRSLCGTNCVLGNAIV